MPGRTPTDAVRAFLEPLGSALCVLDGHAKITVAGPKPYRKGVTYQWSLNGESGMSLGSTGQFYASMRFEIVDSDPTEHDEEHSGHYRCSSRAYNYKLATPRGSDLWRLHWHPSGVSPAKEPHLHVPPDLKRHLPTGRMSFEKTVMWLIEYDAPIQGDRSAALARLAEIEAPHLLYRSWSERPSEARG